MKMKDSLKAEGTAMNEVVRQLYNRKSVRVFQDRVIDESIVEEILRAAVMAPTAGNSWSAQCWRAMTIWTRPPRKLIWANFWTPSPLPWRNDGIHRL